MTPNNPSSRDGIPLQTVIRHSTKILEFFGIPPGASPTNSSRSIADDNNDTVSNARSSGTYHTQKLKQQYPTINHHSRRTKRALSALIQSCTPIW
jgi:hypothetical protein